MRILLLGSDGTLGNGLRQVVNGDLVPWTSKELDLSQADRIRSAILHERPDLVINCAAFNLVDDAEAHETLANKINGEAVGELARACAAQNIVLVHFSTDYVFDGSNSADYAEDARPSPLSTYGKSKLLGERLLMGNTREFILIRTSRLYGHHTPSQRVKKNFVQRILELAESRENVEVVADEVSSPTYAPDLAAATVNLINSRKRGIFHRTNDGSCTWYEFAREILAQIGWRGTLVPVPGTRFRRAARRPHRSVLRSTKLPPLRPWQEALRDYLRALTKSTTV